MKSARSGTHVLKAAVVRLAGSSSLARLFSPSAAASLALAMRTRAQDSSRLAALSVALLVLAVATIGLAATDPAQESLVLGRQAYGAPPDVPASASPSPPPAISAKPLTASPEAGTTLHPSRAPVAATRPTPTPSRPHYTDKELEELAATLTDGKMFESAGAFGATKTLESPGIKIETDIYPVGGTIDDQGKRLTQHHWRVWTPRLVRFVTIDYGDGSTWKSGERVYWTCEAADRPNPYHVSLPDHSWEASGTFTITATLTTTSCDNKDEAGSYGDDVRTHELSMKFVMPNGWMVHPNNSALPGVICTDAAQTCGDLPARYERPGSATP